MSAVRSFDVGQVVSDFPVFKNNPHIYFDNAATTHKPSAVIEAISSFYSHTNANVHRGVYAMGSEATRLFENAREIVADFIGADRDEVVFTSGCTDAINAVAKGYFGRVLQRDDLIVCSPSAHHANLIPWQELASEKGARLSILKVDSNLQLDLEDAYQLIGAGPRVVAIEHICNSTGIRYPIEKIIKAAHDQGAQVVVDAAQTYLNESLDVHEIEADFVAFSGHKVFGPTGVGVLFGKSALLNEMHPFRFGGEMIERVHYDQATYRSAPARHEAGTPAIASVIGLGAALTYLKTLPLDAARVHVNKLSVQARSIVETLGFDIHGASNSMVTFSHPAIHAHDIATILDSDGIAIRAGHHCAQPFVRALGVAATARLSLALYNQMPELERFGTSLEKVKSTFL